METLRWEYKLNDVYTILGKSKSTSIIISKDKRSKDKTNPKVYKEYSYIASNSLKSLIQSNHNLYEVLPDDLPRHFYIDCDIKEDNDIFKMYDYPKIIKLLTNGIFNILQEVNSSNSSENNIYTAYIVENDKEKQSCHIIFPNINLRNVQDTKHFSLILKHYIEDEKCDWIKPEEREIMSKTMDYKVYSSNQNFRLPFQTKLGKDDTYKLMPYTDKCMYYYHVGIYDQNTSWQFLDSLKLQKRACDLAIEMHNKTFPEIANNHNNGIFVSHHFDVFCNLVPPNRYTQSNKDDIKDPVKMIVSSIPNSNEHPQHYSLWWSIGQTLKNISFEKSKTEENERLCIWINWSNQANEVYKNEDKTCRDVWKSMIVRKNKGGQSRYGINFLQSIASYYNPQTNYTHMQDNSMFEDLVDIDKFLDKFNQVKKYNMDSNNLDTVKGYCKQLDYTKVDIIILIAAMGLGKTYVVNESIKANKFKRILLISPRQTFCQEKVSDLQNICQDFRSYLDEDVRRLCDWSMVDKLAIQVESLHKLISIDEYNKYDMLILDEIESIMYQFSSDTHTEPFRCFQVFMELLATSGKIFMADAFITNRTLSLCTNVLIKEHNRQVNLEINGYNPNEKINANIIGISRSSDTLKVLKNTFTDHLIEKLRTNKKICVVVSSKNFKDQIINKTSTELDYQLGKEVLSYDRDTSDEDINKLGQVKEIWGSIGVRMVIYTTKITVGINFDVMDKFDTIYIYGTVYCPIARDLMQSHFRVRNIKEKNIYVALNCCSVQQALPQNKCNINFATFFISDIKRRFGFNALYQDPTVMANYVNNAQYNYLEESIGYSLYAEVFKYFLKATGYNIVLDYNCDKPLTNTYDKQALIPCTYIKRYIEYRSTSPEQIKEIEIRNRLHKASSHDKITLTSYFFSRKYIYGKIDLSDTKIISYLSERDIKYYSVMKDRAEALELPLPEQIECEMFNQANEDKNIERMLDNFTLEISQTKMSPGYGSEKVFKEQERYVMLKYMTKLHVLIGIESSIDTTKNIGNNELEKFMDWFMNTLKENERIVLMTLFCIRVQLDNFGIQQSITVISGMLYRWCGMRLNVAMTTTRPRNENGRKRVNTYTCRLESSLNKSMACYWYSYKLMQEKMKEELDMITYK